MCFYRWSCCDAIFIDASSLRMRVVIVRVQSFPSLSVLWQIAWRGIKPIGPCFQTKPQGCRRCCQASGCWRTSPLPSRRRARRRSGEGVWTCSRFRAGKRIKSGYLGWWNLFQALVALKVALEASRKRATRRVRPTPSTCTPRSSLYTPRKTSLNNSNIIKV